MGRRKVPIKRIEDKSSRQVTFSKRRKGMMKKASELSVLCDVDVAVIVYSAGGRHYDFCSSDSLPEVIQRYNSSSESDPAVSGDAREEESGYASFKTTSELLHIIEEPHLEQLSVADLDQVEEQVADALTQIRSRKTELRMQSLLSLQEKEAQLEEENNSLLAQLDALKDKDHGSQSGLLKFL